MKLPKFLKKLYPVIHFWFTVPGSIMARNLSLWHSHHCCSGAFYPVTYLHLAKTNPVVLPDTGSSIIQRTYRELYTLNRN